VSPRRKIDDSFEELLVEPPPRRPRPWRFIVATSLAALLTAGAIAASSLMLVSHESDRRETNREVDVLGYVRSFMTMYTTLDPFHANDYADRVVAQGTGEFAKTFREKQNEILVSVARAEPTTGTVVEAGVERWNDDGSANVLVATKINSTTPDGKTEIENGSRWFVTAIKEGQQWKISQLMQVI
jgi:Mce-associated membrane protein